MPAVLFVCTGNICRSPTAEGVFRAALEANGLGAAVVVDSAGTGTWHVGEPPDDRAREAAHRRGIDIAGQRARHRPTNQITCCIFKHNCRFSLSRVAQPRLNRDVNMQPMMSPQLFWVGRQEIRCIPPEPHGPHGGTKSTSGKFERLPIPCCFALG